MDASPVRTACSPASADRSAPDTISGVTIEYHDGYPLGALLGAVVSTKPSDGDPSFAEPTLIGSEAVIQPKSDGVLCLRVNDSPAKLGDNAGRVDVKIASVD